MMRAIGGLLAWACLGFFASAQQRTLVNPPDPAAAADGSSMPPQVRDEIRQLEYHYAGQEVPGGLVWSAPNRSQGLRSRVTTSGIELFPRNTDASGEGAPWKLRLRTASFGRQGDERAIEYLGVAASANRVELDAGSLVEWFVNDERGIEQGWTIANLPSGAVDPL